MTRGNRRRGRGQVPQRHMTREVAALHGQLLLWAFIVSEASHQTAAARERRSQREEEVRAYWADEKPPEAAPADIDCRVTIPDRPDSPDTVIVALEQGSGVWPNEANRAIRFALCRVGRVRIECVGFPHGVSLPEGIACAPDAECARAAAHAVVEQAIQRLTEFAKVLRTRRR
jgi:hypothetical protein